MASWTRFLCALAAAVLSGVGGVCSAAAPVDRGWITSVQAGLSESAYCDGLSCNGQATAAPGGVGLFQSGSLMLFTRSGLAAPYLTETQVNQASANLSGTPGYLGVTLQAYSSDWAQIGGPCCSADLRGLDSGANVDLTYWLQITGPTPYVMLQVDSGGYLSSSPWGSSTGAAALLQVLSSDPNAPGKSWLWLAGQTRIISPGTTGTVIGLNQLTHSFTGAIGTDEALLMPTNQWLQVNMEVATDASLALGSGLPIAQPNGAYGWLDPTFSIAAGTPDAGLYGIQLSGGLYNGNSGVAPTVPEPGVGVLFLVGLGVLGGRAVGRARGYGFET